MVLDISLETILITLFPKGLLLLLKFALHEFAYRHDVQSFQHYAFTALD